MNTTTTPVPGATTEGTPEPVVAKHGFATIYYYQADTVEAAQAEAKRRADHEYLVAQSGAVVNGILFEQGDRLMLIGVLRFNVVSTILTSDPADEGASITQLRDKTNRHKNQGHVEAIEAYLDETIPTGLFIMPSLTANVMGPARIHTYRQPGEMQPSSRYAYMYLPMKAVLSITDGQHRQAALAALLEHAKGNDAMLEVLNKSSIPVMITLTDDLKQIHQDFADCGTTRPLPPSVNAVFNSRHPANGLVMQLVESCGIFASEKLDSTNSKLGKKSPGLFLVNMVRQAVKTFITGGYGANEEDFDKTVKAKFTRTGSPEFNEISAFMIDYMNQVTDAVPKLREYADLTPVQVQARFAELRNAGWLFFTATGLAIIARIGWAIRKDGVTDWQEAIARLGSDVDWHRVTNSEWSSLGVATATRVNTGHKAVIAGAAYVASKIGLDLPSLNDKKAGSDEDDTVPHSDNGADASIEQQPDAELAAV